MMKAAHVEVIDSYCAMHRHILDYAGKLTENQLCWQPAPGALSIAFFLWHMGRWADHIQAAVPGMTPELSGKLPPGRQVWEAGNYSQLWKFDSALGYAETGMGMDESAAARLVFPSKEELLDYVRRAFAAAEQAIYAIDAEQFQAEEQSQPMTMEVWKPGGTVGRAILTHLIHDSAHLGMMEYLLGLQSGSGTATV